MAKQEYRTTSAVYCQPLQAGEPMPDPVPPEGERWELLCTTTHPDRLVWTWKRDRIEESGGDNLVQTDYYGRGKG